MRFLAAQRSERDGVEHRLFAGCFGIFGHGNVAGHRPGAARGRARTTRARCRYYQARNEQGDGARRRRATPGCATGCRRWPAPSSVGPGATNMVTGAALATINRLPVLLLPGDVFATRVADPVLQELEDPAPYDVSVNDAFRPVSRFFDRVWRPEQLPVGAARRDAGAHRPGRDRARSRSRCPQDVQAEAYDWPAELFGRAGLARRRGRVPEPAALARAAERHPRRRAGR